MLYRFSVKIAVMDVVEVAATFEKREATYIERAVTEAPPVNGARPRRNQCNARLPTVELGASTACPT
ncbi:MAG: hypothetical protein M3380_04995 [Chloroflexota bacterium]|nr:hypothetical protein [Chloroflexota bacterium]